MSIKFWAWSRVLWLLMVAGVLANPAPAEQGLDQVTHLFASGSYRQVVDLGLPLAQSLYGGGNLEQARQVFQTVSMAAYFLGDQKTFKEAASASKKLQSELADNAIDQELNLLQSDLLSGRTSNLLTRLEELRNRIPAEDERSFDLTLLVLSSLRSPNDLGPALDFLDKHIETLLEDSSSQGRANAALSCLFVSEFLENNLAESELALIYGERALALSGAPEGKSLSHRSRSSDFLTRIYSAAQKPDLALQAFAEENPWGASDSERNLYARHSILGTQHQRLGHDAQAVDHYLKALGALEKSWSRITTRSDLETWADSGFPYSVPQPTRVLSDCLILLNQEKRETEAFELMERFRSRGLTALVSPALAQARNQAKREVLTEYLELRESLSIAEARGQPKIAEQQRLAQLSTQLSSEDPELFALCEVTFPKLNQVQKALGSKTAGLSYHCGPERTLLLVITDGQLALTSIPLKVEELRTEVRELNTKLRTAEEPLDQETQDLLRRLGSRLFDPAEPYLQGKEHLVLVPSGPLHYLPASALKDSQGRHLVERFSLSQVPSFGILLNAQAQKNSTKTTPSSPPAVFALGNYQPSYGSFAPLPATLPEAKSVAALVGATSYVEDLVTKAKVLRALKEAPLVHLATHGEFQASEPLSSRLILADEPLSAKELFQLNSEASLVIASACQTGLAEVRSGDELMGLSRGFFYSGIPSQVLTLWSVSDQATQQFMESVYQSMARGQTPARALRQAQLKFLDDGSHYQHPFYWAPFFLNGVYLN